MMICKKRRYLWIILVMLVLLCTAFCFCPHKKTYTKVVKQANCFETGQIDTICKMCVTIIESRRIEKTNHIFGAYELKRNPSASAPGLEVRVCSVCLKEEEREFDCLHKVKYNKVVKESTCGDFGQIDVICNMCETILESNSIEKKEHTFSEYDLIRNPSASAPGLEVRVCSVCLKEEEREYDCPHEVTYNKVVKEATCCELGQIDIICELCEVVLENVTLKKTAHIFGAYKLVVKPSVSKPGIEVRTCLNCSKQEKRDYFCAHETNAKEEWTYIKYATPLKKGERYKNCLLCGTVVSEAYAIPALENNSIYITGTDINHRFTISSFTQNAVDKYDIVYTEDVGLGTKNPFVLGHNTRSLGILDQTKVGELVYVYINGVIEIYEVVVSEYALLNASGKDMIGKTTGTSIWHEYESKTLHIYTCYGVNTNGRWIVLAKKIF